MSRYIETIIVVLWAHKNRDRNRYLEGAYRGIGMPFDEFKTIFIKGLPLMLNELFWAAGMTTVTQCYSVRGLSVIAGLNIATTITNLFNIVFIQLGACISIVVGQYLGAGELEKAKDADNKMIVFSVFCCSIMAAVMLLVGGFFPQIYNTTDEIKSLATRQRDAHKGLGKNRRYSLCDICPESMRFRPLPQGKEVYSSRPVKNPHRVPNHFCSLQ